jgi:hypothetical protein
MDARRSRFLARQKVGWLMNARFWRKSSWSLFGTMLDRNVRIIALSAVKTFLNGSPAHTDGREPVMAWFRPVKGGSGLVDSGGP